MSLPFNFLVPFVDFSRGFNSDASTYTIKDNESPELRNVRISPLGPISGRYGVERLNDLNGYTFANSKPIRTMVRFYREDGTHYIIFTVDDKIYALDTLSDITEAGLTPPDALVTGAGPVVDPFIFPAGQIDKAWETVTYKDWLFLTTLGAPLYRTNGVYIEEVGVAANAPNADNLVTGAVNWLPAGDFARYVATYVTRDGLGESPTSAVYVVENTDPGAREVEVTVPASGRTVGDVVATRLYRELQPPDSLGDGSGPFYFVLEVATDGMTDELDAKTDAELEVKVDITRAAPPSGAFVVEHQDRLWLGKIQNRPGGSAFTRYTEMSFSDSAAPEQWPADFGINFPNDAGETLRGATSAQNILMVTTMNRLNGVIGTGIERGIGSGDITIPDYRGVELARGPGSISHRVIQQRDGVVYMLNKLDLWRISDRGVEPVTQFRLREWIKGNMDYANIQSAVATVTHTDYRVSFPAFGGNLSNELTLLYDTQGDSFLLDEGYAPAAYAYLIGEEDTGDLWASEGTGINGAYIYKMDSTNQDWDPSATAYKDIERFFRTKDFPFGRRIGETVQGGMLYVDTPTASIDPDSGSGVEVAMFVNKNRFEQALRSLDLTAKGPLWGAFNWGDARWGVAGNFLHHVSLPQSGQGELLGFSFRQMQNEEPFSIEMIAVGGWFRGARSVSV